MTRGLTITALSTSLALLLAACAGGADADPDGKNGPTRPGAVAQTGSATSAGPAQDDRATTADPQAPQTSLVWSTDLRPVTGPVLVDDALALYTLGPDERLMMTVLDAQTGEQLWSRPASASAVAVARPLEPQVVDGRLVYLQPTVRPDLPEDAADVIERVPRTGTSRGTGTTWGVHGQLPHRCPGSRTEVCAVLLDDDGDNTWPVVVSSSRVPAPWTPTGDETAGHFVEPVGPLDLARAGGQRIGRLVDDHLLWEVSTADVVGTDASTNSGWRFVAHEDRLLIGTVGLTDVVDGSDLDLTESAVFALDAATGRRTWIDHGSDLRCNSALWSGGTGPLLACRYDAGVWHWTEDGSAMLDLDASLVRLDPATGETLWSAELPEGDLDGVVVPGVLDEEHAVVLGQVVDVRDGSARERTEDDLVWFPDLRRAPVDRPGEHGEEVAGAGLWRVPDGLGLDDAGTLPAWPLPPGVGLELDDGSRVVTHEGGVARLASLGAAP